MRRSITKEKIEELVEYWLKRYGLYPFEVEVNLILKPEDEPDEKKREHAANIYVKDGYRSAVLTVYEYNVRLGELNTVIFHEISHILHWRVFDWLEDLTREKDQNQIRKFREDIVTHLEFAMFPKLRKARL